MQSALIAKPLVSRSVARPVARRPTVQPVRAFGVEAVQMLAEAGDVDAPILVPIVASVVIGLGVTAFVTFGLKSGTDAQAELAEQSKKGWNGPLSSSPAAIRNDGKTGKKADPKAAPKKK